MPKLKRTFLTNGSATLTIVGGYPDGDPYIRIEYITTVIGNIDDKKEIELLAVNILKALKAIKSKR